MRGEWKQPSRPLAAALLGMALFAVLASASTVRPLMVLAAPAKVHPHASPTPPPPTPAPTPAPPPRPSSTPAPTAAPIPVPPPPAAIAPPPAAAAAANPEPSSAGTELAPPDLVPAAGVAGSTAVDSVAPGGVLARTGPRLAAAGAPTPDSSLVLWILLLAVAAPLTVVLALISLVLVRR